MGAGTFSDFLEIIQKVDEMLLLIEILTFQDARLFRTGDLL